MTDPQSCQIYRQVNTGYRGKITCINERCTNWVVSATKKKWNRREVTASLQYCKILLLCSQGALDSEIVAAIVRKVAKLYSEAGGSGN